MECLCIWGTGALSCRFSLEKNLRSTEMSGKDTARPGFSLVFLA